MHGSGLGHVRYMGTARVMMRHTRAMYVRVGVYALHTDYDNDDDDAAAAAADDDDDDELMKVMVMMTMMNVRTRLCSCARTHFDATCDANSRDVSYTHPRCSRSTTRAVD